ncbi:MAG: copper transporter [Proteobacteria bacterium]|nr:MAG: copper transporter [Pseudomonadota bacterium]
MTNSTLPPTSAPGKPKVSKPVTSKAMKAVLFSVFGLFVAGGVYAFVAQAAAPRVIEMKVTTAGYVPAEITIDENEAVDLKITRETNITCATEIVIPDLKINQPLPLNEAVVVHLPKLAGGVHRFGCAMDLMISGNLKVGSSMSH